LIISCEEELPADGIFGWSLRSFRMRAEVNPVIVGAHLPAHLNQVAKQERCRTDPHVNEVAAMI
jgi:hypothetical protein